MNDKLKARVMYPIESLRQLGQLGIAFDLSGIESIDQLDDELNMLEPVLESWFQTGGMDDNHVIIIAYSQPGNPHLYSVTTHLINLAPDFPSIDFESIVQQLHGPPNIIDPRELNSFEELERGQWAGRLRIVIAPLSIWEKLPQLEAGDKIESLVDYWEDLLTIALHWIAAHPLPEGWHVEWFIADGSSSQS